jgi:hypothetical protein
MSPPEVFESIAGDSYSYIAGMKKDVAIPFHFSFMSQGMQIE